MPKTKIHKGYLKGLSKNNKESHKNYILKRRKAYNEGKFYTKKENLKSHPNKESKHIIKVKKLYGIEFKESEIEKATGITKPAQKKIIKKGIGAFFSSGSRPNQTPQSWAKARLASVILKDKCYKIDKHILEEYNITIKPPPKQKGGKKSKKIKSCCVVNESKNKKCYRKSDKKEFELPRKFSKKKCKNMIKSPEGLKGFTTKSSCAPYINCF